MRLSKSLLSIAAALALAGGTAFAGEEPAELLSESYSLTEQEYALAEPEYEVYEVYEIVLIPMEEPSELSISSEELS